jgi:polyhydroxybutyrate depolymerase
MRRALIPVAAGLLLLGACAGQVGSQSAGSPERHVLQHGGRDRSYILRVPPAVETARSRIPLVLVLHGGGGNGDNAEAMTGFTAKGRSEAFIAAYPEGTARGRIRLFTWNAGHCCGYAMESGIDDVGYIAVLIDHLLADCPIDPNRIFITGMSNGAMMAHRLGRELPGRIAAIAPVVGGLFGDEAVSRANVSAIMISGLLDASVPPYTGGATGGRFGAAWDGTQLKPAEYQAQYWAAANRCQPEPAVRETSAYRHLRYTCSGSSGVELYAVKDNGHAWPGGQRGSRLGDRPSQALDATDVIWTFFAAHPKR